MPEDKKEETTQEKKKKIKIRLDFLKSLTKIDYVGAFKSLWKRKLLLMFIVGLVALIVSIALLISIFTRPKTVEIKSEQGTTVVKNLYIQIPQGAFPYKKEFNLIPITSQDNPDLFASSPFVDTIYDVVPTDGKNDMAYIPIRYRYYFPQEFYQGIEYNNIALAYIPENSNVYRIFPGSYIGLDDKGYYAEAQSFHSSKIGVVVLSPKKQELGIKVLAEQVSEKPVVLIVPGTDKNFSGYFKSEINPDVNLWSVIFPDRTIMLYNYPLYQTRSKMYQDMANDFFKRTGLKSYIEFEAERLITELKRFKNFKFDIVAQDVGGLIVYYALALHPEIQNVRKVAYVSVPFSGTNIVNPVYFSSLLYGKNPEALSAVYNIQKDIITAIQNHIFTFIETVNTYWSDLIPGSEFLKKISQLNPPSVESIAFMGTKPPLSIDVSGSSLEKFYPELARGKGDGIVVNSSAKIGNMQLVPIKGSVYSYYSTTEFVNKLKEFFAYKTTLVPEYKDDTYREYISKTEKEREVYLSRLRPYRFDGAKIGNSVVLTPDKTLEYPGKQIAIFKSVIYTADKDGLYGNGTKLLDGPINNLKASFGGVSFRTTDKIYFYSPAVKKVYDVVYAGDFLATTEGVYTAIFSGNTVSFWDPKNNKIKELRGQYGKFKVDKNYLIMFTNKQIFIPKLNLTLSVPETEGKSLDITDVIVVRNEVFAITRNYGLIFFDIGTGNGIYIGEGWIGNKGIHQIGNYIFTIGENFVTIVDLAERRVLRIIEKVDAQVFSSGSDTDYLYLVTDRGIIRYKILKD
ncbi:hypothetical protein JYK00_00105 [Thermosipho ferrireducens]|uniref:Uncharacterized protein n=1 Tax=Thermosipho ferrireducens TaxID=2571116 RepID=A0ABX7S714_9BACT|nr:hypothetical protein [Thermosipho ferrireducens]QTA37994.1 hypothetical protein JYK00_00105 [Thermosipho ferrireducens]